MNQSTNLQDRTRENRRLLAALSVVSGFFFLVVLGILVFGEQAFAGMYSTDQLISNAGIVLIALAIIAGLYFLPRRDAGQKNIRGNTFLILYFLVLLGVQLLVARGMWFYAGWDVSDVYESAYALATGGTVDQLYFATNTNNAVLTIVLSVPLRIAIWLGKDVPYTVLVYLSVLLVNLACFVCMLCVRKVTESKSAWIAALLLCTFWIGLSLTITIPYSDTYSILFPVLALYVYLSGKKSFIKWLLISLLCFAGAAIKPTVLICLIAMIAVHGVQALFNRQGKIMLRRGLVVALAIVIGAVPVQAVKLASAKYLTGEYQPEEQHTMTHFLMMGMNSDTYGGNDPDDVTYSSSFETLSERQEANLSVAWERFTERGVSGNITFFAVKIFKAFADGTLAQSKSYLELEVPVRNGWMELLLEDVFYADGEYHALFQTIEQTAWIGILLLILAAMFLKSRKNAVTAVLAITLLGIGIDQMLFEVWPRYLYIFAPLFVVLAAIGLDEIRRCHPVHTSL